MCFASFVWIGVSIGGDLSFGQAQNGIFFYFKVQFDPAKTIGTLTKVFCIYGPNLVILALERVTKYRTDKLVIDGHTNAHTHTLGHTGAGNDNTRRPKLASGENEIADISVTQICSLAL